MTKGFPEFSYFSRRLGIYTFEGNMVSSGQICNYSWLSVFPDCSISASLEGRSVSFIKCDLGFKLLPQRVYFIELVILRIMGVVHSKVKQTSLMRVDHHDVGPTVRIA